MQLGTVVGITALQKEMARDQAIMEKMYGEEEKKKNREG
jgi:hypothetical protein